MGTCCYPNSNYIYRAETVCNIQHDTGIVLDMKDNINEEIFSNMPEVPWEIHRSWYKEDASIKM